MKTKTKLLLLAMLLTAATAMPAAAAPIDARQARQQWRINQGAWSGQLTGCETVRLQARSHRIAAREHAYRTSGGLQPRERYELQRRLDRLSADINEQRHDGRGCY